MILVDDLLRDIFQSAHFRVQQDVGLAVKGFALFEQLFNFRQWIRFIQQRAMGLIVDAVPNFFRRSPETNDERMAFEAGEIIGIHRQAAAGRNDGFLSQSKLGDDFPFQLAEGRFAVLGKNLADAFIRPRLDDVIGIQKSKVQLLGDELAHGRFPRSHEANERNVLNVALGAHPNEVADLGDNRTKKTSNNQHPMKDSGSRSRF